MSKQLVWITGAAGLIGNYLAQTVPAHFQPRGLTRADLDLLDFNQVTALFKKENPAAIIHCAAISKNPVCDADPQLARSVNTDVTVHLSKLASDLPFSFLSTDLIFDGKKGNYIETDSPNPLSIYAETKVRAEEIVGSNPNHTIIRTSLNAGHSLTGNRSFNEEIRGAFKANRALNLFEDEFRCPIPAEITARAIWHILGQPGIFHLCGAEKLSRYQIGELLAANHPNLNPRLIRGSLREYKGSPRSPDTSMNCGKIQNLLPFALPGFSSWVQAQPQGSL